MQIHVELKRADALCEVERESWMKIQTSSARLASPYFALGYADAVAKARADTRIVIQYDQGVPVAFLPLQIGGFGHARPLGGPLADHHGVIAAPETEVDMQALLSAAGVSVYDFFGLLPHRGDIGDDAHYPDGSWVVDLDGGFEAFTARRKKLGGNTFRTIFASNRKLREAGHSLDFCFDDKSPQALDKLLTWKSAQYEASGHFDVFSRSWPRDLVLGLRASSGDTGVRGVVSSLKVDGDIAAVHFGMMTPRAMHYWFPAYDPALAKAAPGNALLEHLLRSLAEQGVSEVHLGPGDYRYKAALGSWQMPLAKGFVAVKGPAAALRRAAHLLESGAEGLPLGRMARWPGKAFRRIDQIDGFRAA